MDDDDFNHIVMKMSGRTLLDLLGMFDYQLSSIEVDDVKWDKVTMEFTGGDISLSLNKMPTKDYGYDEPIFSEVVASFPISRHDKPILKLK